MVKSKRKDNELTMMMMVIVMMMEMTLFTIMSDWDDIRCHYQLKSHEMVWIKLCVANQPTDRPTDGRTYIMAYRDAKTHLKRLINVVSPAISLQE